MDIMMIARVLVGLVGVAAVLGGLLFLLSFVVPRLRFARGTTNADRDNETGAGRPRLP